MLRVRHVVLKACGIAVARACKLCQEEGRVLAGTRAWGGHVVLVAAAVKHGDCRDDKCNDNGGCKDCGCKNVNGGEGESDALGICGGRRGRGTAQLSKRGGSWGSSSNEETKAE